MTKKETVPTMEASPYKSTAEELAALRKPFRLACRSYLERVEMEIIRIHEQVVTAGMAASAGESRKPTSPSGARSRINGASAPNGRAANGVSAASRAQSEIADLRDMLTLLRTLEIKPEAGRRKDLKKIESLVEDLRVLSERWG